jgi:hypothetical protein
MSMKAGALAWLTAAFEAAGNKKRAVATATAKAALDSARRATKDTDDKFCHTAGALNAAATALACVGDPNKANAARREAWDIALNALRTKESVP